MRAILEKYLPGIAGVAETSLVGRMMPLTRIGTFDPRITDDVLAKIEAEVTALDSD